MAETKPTEPSGGGEFAPGPATKVLVEMQLEAYAELRVNGYTPTLEKPHPGLRLLWLRVNAQTRGSDALAAVELRREWANADEQWGDPSQRDFRMRSSEAFFRAELIENFLHDSGWTDLKARETDSLVPYLDRDELEVSR